MIKENIVVWNVRGLNARARRNVVRELVSQEHVSLISLQETKLDGCDDRIILDMLGSSFDYSFLPAYNNCGGILLAWKRDVWAASGPNRQEFSLTAKVTHVASGEDWWLTNVYGPQGESDKIRFLEEPRSIKQGCPDRWLVCGDFNLIYKAEDKNNSLLNRRMMGAFQALPRRNRAVRAPSKWSPVHVVQ